MSVASQSSPLPATPGPLAQAHDAAFLDLDGTVYVGAEAVAGAADTVRALRDQGVACVFLTNNASRPTETIAEKLRAMGLPAAPGDVVTSAQAAARLLAHELPSGSRVLLVGGEGLDVALRAEGLCPVRSAEDRPAAVVQGLSTELAWPDLAEAAFAVAQGVPWVATNRDLTLPTSRGLAPGNGSLVEVVRLVTGREPRVAGKPEPALLDAARARTASRAPVVVGDRLDTDIATAVRAGVPSLLVLTGVTDARLLLRAAPGQRPTYVAATISGVLRPHPGVVADGAGTWTCERWTAAVDEGVLRLVPPAGRAGGAGPGGSTASASAPAVTDPVDGLRAACAATWSALDAGAEVDVGPAVALLGM